MELTVEIAVALPPLSEHRTIDTDLLPEAHLTFAHRVIEYGPPALAYALTLTEPIAERIIIFGFRWLADHAGASWTEVEHLGARVATRLMTEAGYYGPVDVYGLPVVDATARFIAIGRRARTQDGRRWQYPDQPTKFVSGPEIPAEAAT